MVLALKGLIEFLKGVKNPFATVRFAVDGRAPSIVSFSGADLVLTATDGRPPSVLHFTRRLSILHRKILQEQPTRLRRDEDVVDQVYETGGCVYLGTKSPTTK